MKSMRKIIQAAPFILGAEEAATKKTTEMPDSVAALSTSGADNAKKTTVSPAPLASLFRPDAEGVATVKTTTKH